MKCIYQTGDVISILLNIGFKVHLIDEEKFIYGVYSSESKIYDRFEKVLEEFPMADLTESENLCQGDYILYLKGKPITTLKELYGAIKTILNVEEYDDEYMLVEIRRTLDTVEGV